MCAAQARGTPTFKQLEQAGWQAKASAYDESLGVVTAQAVAPLLDAVRLQPGMTLLDVACGPGYSAGRAAARGARAIGIDFADAMAAEAQRLFPDAEFRHGDGEALEFADASFDAVVCPFGLLHMPDPDRAVAEAARVLRPGGRYAFTVWCAADKHDLFAVVLGAIQAHGTMDVPLPPAPPIFRFSDPAECEGALRAAGFAEIEVREIPLTWQAPSAEDVVDVVYRSTVRTSMLLEAQAANAREKIHAAIIEGAARFKTGDVFEMAWPAVLACAAKT